MSSANEKSVGHELARVLPDDGVPWWKKPHLLKLNGCIFFLMFFTSSNGFDGSIMNGYLALPQWRAFMHNPQGAWLGFINAIYSLGAVVAFPLAAMVCNRWGRKIGLWLSIIAACVGTAVQTAAQDDKSFIIARFIMGISQGLSIGAPLLIAENAFPTHRGIASSCYNCGWYVGAVIAAWATFGTRNMEGDASWRIPSGLMALLPVLIAPALYFIDESPRWLVSVGRADEARANLARTHVGGDIDHPLIAFEMSEIEETIRAEQSAKESTSWSDLWATKGNRHRLWITITLGFYAQWVGNGVISYYLALVLQNVGITGVTEQTLISACLQIWNLIFATLAALSVDRLGRKFLFMLSGSIMLVSYVIITGLSGSFAETGHGPTGLAVVPFLFIYFLGYDVALTPLVISYTVEIWPYQLRARGLAVCSSVTLGAIFFNTFVNPLALDAIGWKYYFVFLAILVMMIVDVWFTYPETRGRTLENIAWLFDGEEAHVGIVTADQTLKNTESSEGEPKVAEFEDIKSQNGVADEKKV
ncbi:hypothetical protein MCOR27_010563 [Pyricularia oryzae]|nr:hypothetical protein MCOR01_005728 [Pyricularia oryzae]KAI6260997.1 hypothetical protein MCOR19_002760 [Pyricularia oryzae]KAI6267487.1 hypothetical protein MCOR27_010563 [Pyricularia oryzae]KAI6280712.1 hypothetical protein MCOR26_003631 [Pyricularia oryzae]KAI6326585.1 hypothetical protein MCOR34_000678 [Pyricularia oryzae]